MIVGCEQPRIFTPPLRKLTRTRTEGFAVIAFAEQVLGLRLFPWQKWLLLHGLELDGTGRYRFRTVCVEVARQSGKTLLMIVLALYHIYVKDSRTVIGTAQDLANAEKAWAEAVELAQSEDELEALIERITLAHPKSLKLVTGCEYRVATASRRGARGFSGDLILLDELREHQSWDSWAAVTNTMNARPKAQTWAFSNAGDAMSIVLRYLRTSAHQALGWPDGDADRDILGEVDANLEGEGVQDLGNEFLGWFEWSAPPNAARSDRQAWAQANPSLNHTKIIEDCVTERALAAQLRTSPPTVFDAEVLCRWSFMTDSGPWPEGSWAATIDSNARPAQGSGMVVCVEVSSSRSQTCIARAGLDNDGVAVGGIWADRPGTDWVLDYLCEHRDSYMAVVVRATSGAPVRSLLADFVDAGLPVVEWKGADFPAAHGQLFDRLRDGTVKHLPHPGLDTAAMSAVVKPLEQGGWTLSVSKSPSDVAPLLAFVGVVWGLANQPAATEVWGMLV